MSNYLRSNYKWPSEMRKMILKRTGARPLVGHVLMIGEGSVAGTGTTLRVYVLKRKRGGYVKYNEHLTIWDGASDYYTATLCKTPEELLAALGGDAMRPAEHEAWAEACTHDPALAAINQVEI